METIQTQFPVHEQVRPFLTAIGAAEYDAAVARWQADQLAGQLAEARARITELEEGVEA